MNYYPVNFNLKNKNVLIVGGGRVAYRKLKRLLTTGARIKVISPVITDNIRDKIDSYEIEYQQREFNPADIADMFLIIAATDQKEVNENIAKLAQEKNIPVNVVDNKELSDFILPATIDQGDLLITIATGGCLPALSREIRRKFEEEFGQGYSDYLLLMQQVREVVKSQIDSEVKRRNVFQQLADLKLIEIFAANRDQALKIIQQILIENLNCKVEINGNQIIKKNR